MRKLAALCLALLCLTAGAEPASGSSSSVGIVVTPYPDAVEVGFQLSGSHGYTISASAYSDGTRPNGQFSLTARRGRAAVTYVADAKVTRDSIEADLGKLGSVRLSRRDDAREKTAKPRCGGRPFVYESAHFEGLVEFTGEGGFTHVTARRVKQVPAFLSFLGPGDCGSGSGAAFGPAEPGARLRAVSFAHGRNLTLQVNKNGPKTPLGFAAGLKERRDGIFIRREVSGFGPSDAFRYDRGLRAATLSPPPPFSGSASLTRSKNSVAPIWRGDLAVDFPGRRSVPVAGPNVHVSIVHAHFTRNDVPSVEVFWP